MGVLGFGVAACDIPTDLPEWNPTYAVPLADITIGVSQLLPPSVTLANGNTAFSISLAPVSFGTSLGQLCPACAAFNGQTVAKPAFSGTFSTAIPLPTDVLGATLISGRLGFMATNGFSFDPIRPGGPSTGSLSVRVIEAGGALIGSRVIAGAVQAWPPGSTLTDSLELAGTGSSFAVATTIDSPAGGTAQINTAARIDVTATPVQLLLSSVQLRVQNRQLSAQPVQLDLTGIDEFIIDRVQGGSFVLELTNGFAVGGSMTLVVSGGPTQITKQVAIPAADATVEVPFTESELESMLGRVVVISLSGLVSSDNGVTVTPSSALHAGTLLVLELGASS